MSTAEVALTTDEDRHDPVFAWRFRQFLELGFAADDSWLLAISDADLHASRSLVGGGCPLPLALRILV